MVGLLLFIVGLALGGIAIYLREMYLHRRWSENLGEHEDPADLPPSFKDRWK